MHSTKSMHASPQASIAAKSSYPSWLDFLTSWLTDQARRMGKLAAQQVESMHKESGAAVDGGLGLNMVYG